MNSRTPSDSCLAVSAAVQSNLGGAGVGALFTIARLSATSGVDRV